MITVYLSIPIKYRNFAKEIEQKLGKRGITVLNPCDIVEESWSKEDIPYQVANECYRMIEISDAVILYTDYYGLDCATEIGYALAKYKSVFPFCFSFEHSFFERSPLQSNWMIKPFLEAFSENLDSLAAKILKKFALSGVY